MNSSKLWIAGLLVSVLLNGVLIGFVLNRVAAPPAWQGYRDHRTEAGPRRSPPPLAAGFDMRAFLAALPEEERRVAGARLHADMLAMGGTGREIFEAARLADAALAAEPFDPEAVRLALGRVRELRLAMERTAELSLIEIVADLDPDVRAAALQAGRARGFHSGRNRGHRPDGERWRRDRRPPPATDPQ